ncbi:MAG: molybdenum cofactor biosynthesis protein MoaE [Syntrophales bacterium]|jgi:molybdopterin synthase catalytic subunit
MSIAELIQKIKKHPRYNEVGMILCHNGVVRGTSRNGRPVTELMVRVNRQILDDILAAIRNRQGIIEALAEVREGTLKVGDDVMYVVVAGDFRENVFPAIQDAVNLIKHHVTEKTGV